MGNFKIGQHYDEALRSMQPADINRNAIRKKNISRN